MIPGERDVSEMRFGNRVRCGEDMGSAFGEGCLGVYRVVIVIIVGCGFGYWFGFGGYPNAVGVYWGGAPVLEAWPMAMAMAMED